RVDLRKVNKRVVESLIKCGALDSLGHRRSQMMAVLEEALEYGQRMQREKADPQMGLFGGGDTAAPAINAPGMPDITEWEPRKALALEKESLGFYLSGHPLNRYEDAVAKFTNANAVSIRETADKSAVRIGGLISGVRTLRTKKGDPMAFVQVEDLQGTVEVIVFPDTYAGCEALLREDAPVFVQGQAQKEENAVRVVAETIVDMEQAEEIWTASVHITIDMARAPSTLLADLQHVLVRHPGTCRTFVHLVEENQSETIIAADDALRLKAGARLTREVNGLLGYAALETRCTPATLTNNGNGRPRWDAKRT
ncbi:MAG TPA: OB-fold nucleic acid binding domain-containing protein, partial [Desulfosarcina sp.]|nr:OB-fold nucleic acid binding domain-containing protein [Desulfosarcina sp.]